MARANYFPEPRKWTFNEVEEWLERIGLGEYNLIFRGECIDGKALSELAHLLSKNNSKDFEGLIKQLKLKTLGHRLWFQAELRELFR